MEQAAIDQAQGSDLHGHADREPNRAEDRTPIARADVLPGEMTISGQRPFAALRSRHAKRRSRLETKACNLSSSPWIALLAPEAGCPQARCGLHNMEARERQSCCAMQGLLTPVPFPAQTPTCVHARASVGHPSGRVAIAPTRSCWSPNAFWGFSPGICGARHPQGLGARRLVARYPCRSAGPHQRVTGDLVNVSLPREFLRAAAWLTKLGPPTTSVSFPAITMPM